MTIHPGDAAADASFWEEHLHDEDIDDGEIVDVELARPLTSTFSLRIPANELEVIRVAAGVEQLSVSEWVRRACRSALEQQTAGRPERWFDESQSRRAQRSRRRRKELDSDDVLDDDERDEIAELRDAVRELSRRISEKGSRV